jgi:membrane-associated protease RseP (regulator of RpoE activity)
MATYLHEGLNNTIFANNQKYVAIADVSSDLQLVALYYSTSAINNLLPDTILKINGQTIANLDTLGKELTKYSPEDKVNITVLQNKEEKTYEITLGENPKTGNAWLGVAFLQTPRSGLIGKFYEYATFFKEDFVYYKSNIGEAGTFIYNLIWWIMIINLLVGLFNMLPLGPLDGGRFWYLTILDITKSKKIAEKSFGFWTYFILLLFAALMVKWVWGFIF